MKPRFYLPSSWPRLFMPLLAAALLTPRAAAWQAAAAPPEPAATLTAAEREAAAHVRTETIREVTTALAGSEMQGRGTAQPGGEKAARYIADRFAKLGLKPLGDKGTYLQAITFKSAQVLPESSLKVGDAALTFGEDFVVTPLDIREQVPVSGELVFAGYGVVSPDLKRDDLAGLDIKGKIVALLSGRPKNVDAPSWAKAANQQAVVGGLIRRGAAGVILANVASKNQPFPLLADFVMRRQVALADRPARPVRLPPLLLLSSAGAEKLFAGSGMTFTEALARAENGDVVSRNLNRPATIALRVKEEEAVGSNVVAVLEGSDPQLKDQALVYSAHYGAFGVGPNGRIYPGAADNALGVAEMIAVAEAFARSPRRPRRSIVFLAVTGEEYGLLGSRYWVRSPTWPIEKVAANLNFDGIGTEVYGPVKRIVGYGSEHSDLGAVLASVVAATGNTLWPDPLPEQRVFYRSDHYTFVQRGIPALMLLGGPEGEATTLLDRIRKWLVTDYHQPTDTVRPEWHWDGARTAATISLLVGRRVADADAPPAWLPSSPFNRPRGATEPPPRR